MLDWEKILFNDAPLSFLVEIVLRSTIMFLALIVVLKMTGKRGIKQLSIFEMVIIISLGSAAGDPMLYEDVGVVHALVVFIVVLLLYRVITWLIGKSEVVEKFLEGKPECLVDSGRFSFNKFKRESLSPDEFFSELRLRNIEHLGQVKKAYIETSGNISVFFYEDKDVIPGLPILPEIFEKQFEIILKPDSYCCCNCGAIADLKAGRHVCSICEGTKWVLPINTKRVS